MKESQRKAHFEIWNTQVQTLKKGYEGRRVHHLDVIWCAIHTLKKDYTETSDKRWKT